MAKSRRNRSRGSRSRRSRGSRSRRSRGSRSRRSRNSRSKKRQRGGFAAILKEAVVPIAFLSGNIKLKKGTFGNKKVMIPVFKNMNQAKYNRDKKHTKKNKLRRRNNRKRRRTMGKKRRRR